MKMQLLFWSEITVFRMYCPLICHIQERWCKMIQGCHEHVTAMLKLVEFDAIVKHKQQCYGPEGCPLCLFIPQPTGVALQT